MGDEQRDVILKEFINVIKHNKLIPFGIGLHMEAWRSLSEKETSKFGTPQHFCFLNLMGSVARFLISQRPNDILHIVSDISDCSIARFRLFPG